ncbi:hepcidin-like [Notolabrus celidotus]|uniref:hepcidin-like n=1 Tax=Notolabrus celidotus TaxID=1203425 RepID=UPI00149062F4|nr:hepcidin-like [Notolabrus celidotus]
MKTLRVAVVVAVVLTFICIQESSAVPVTEVQLEEPNNNDSPVAEHSEHPEASVDAWMMPYNSRQKRSGKCKICCGCCTPGVCGLCCKF